MDSTKGRIIQKAIICNVMLACITLVDFFMTVFFKTRFSRIAEKTVLSLNFRHSFTVRLVSHQSGTHGVREISSTFKTKLTSKWMLKHAAKELLPFSLKTRFPSGLTYHKLRNLTLLCLCLCEPVFLAMFLPRKWFKDH